METDTAGAPQSVEQWICGQLGKLDRLEDMGNINNVFCFLQDLSFVCGLM